MSDSAPQPPGRNRAARLEVGAWLVAVGLQVFYTRQALVLGTRTLAHDHLYWGYPAFHFYAESLLSGRLPLWNPFTHGGEPFYPMLSQIRLLDLSSLLVTFIGRAFTTDLMVLYDWDRFVRGLILIIGVYLLLRPWTQHRLTRFALVVILCFSSFLWSPLRQMALADQFIFAPYVGIFLFRILAGDSRWRNWIALAGFFGLNWQSYFFTGTSLFIFFVLLGCLLSRRSLLRNLISTPQLLPKLAVAGVLVAGLCLPNFSLLYERNRFVFPARMLDDSYGALPPQGGPAQYEPVSGSERFGLFGLPYGFIYHTGSFSSIWDFIQMLAPFANAVLREGQSPSQFLPHRAWGGPSEAFLYIGMIPYCLAILGLLAGTHPLKRIWLTIGVGFGLVMLGPEAGVHALLYWLFPVMRFMRHTHALSLFFTTALLFLFVLGADRLLTLSGDPLLSGHPERGVLARPRRWKSLPRPVSALILGCFLVGTAILMAKLRFPMKFYQIPLIGMLAGAIWIGRRQVGDLWLFWTLITGHLAVISISSRLFRMDVGFLVFILVFLIVPLAVWLCRQNDEPLELQKVSLWALLVAIVGGTIWTQASYLGRPNAIPIELAVIGVAASLLAILLLVMVLGNRGSCRAIPALLILLVVADLLYYSSYVSHAVQWKRPDSFLAYRASLQAPRFPGTRRVFSEYPVVSPYGQPVRYLSILYREPTAFMPLSEQEARRAERQADSPTKISLAVQEKRVSSFLMLKNYYRLVTALASVPAIEEVFAIGRPLIQFKEGYDVQTAEQALIFLQGEQSQAPTGWLERNVILSTPTQERPHGVNRRPVDALPASASSGSGPPTFPRFDWAVERYDYNSLALRVHAGRPGLLYWADGYDQGWRAFVDGRPVPLYRANVNFKAVALPEGTHTVRFEYVPRIFLIATGIFYAIQVGLVLWGLAILVTSLASRAKLAGGSQEKDLHERQALRDEEHR